MLKKVEQEPSWRNEDEERETHVYQIQLSSFGDTPLLLGSTQQHAWTLDQANK